MYTYLPEMLINVEVLLHMQEYNYICVHMSNLFTAYSYMGQQVPSTNERGES